ncbi:MAG: FG-GAP-like repeat-containing protein [Thermodesulfobacteriota bacterium]|nr:FG-GAP-like repeat-containing protein [Thermodesulfobacteriota bacterium]
MKKSVLIILALFIVPSLALAYFPDDPGFMCAEPGTPYYDLSKTMFDEAYAFFGFSPDYSAYTARNWDKDHFFEPQVSGSSIDRAWDIERGHDSVVIAIIDTGVVWGDEELTGRFFLNKEELVVPDPAGHPGVWDLNGDGIFNAWDYQHPEIYDLYVADWNQNNIIDPQDLIHAYSDGVDDDDNGFIDDICGWDFFEDDNDPTDTSSYFTGHHHGMGQAKRAAGEQDNGIGVCGVAPHCRILPLKNWDSFTVNTDYYGIATLYAARMGAKIIEGAIGGINSSGICKKAFSQADEQGLAIFIVSSDINSANHNFPTYLDEPVYCSGIVPDTFALKTRPHTFFRDSNLSQYGSKNQISFEVQSGSKSTAMSSGAGALLFSYAKRNDLELYPNQVKQLLTMTALDILPENTHGIGREDPAQYGWDQHFGYGRVNMFKALAMMRQGNCPPVARITSPSWSFYFDPRKGALTIKGDVLGQDLSWTIEAGYGVEPKTFTYLGSGTTTGRNIVLKEITGEDLKAIAPDRLGFSSLPSNPDDKTPGEADIQPNQHLFTLRLRVKDSSVDRVLAEDRRGIFMFEDTHLHTGWPIYMGTGGEAGIRFEDLDGDNFKEVIAATSDGRILVFTHDGKPYTYKGKPVDLHADTFYLALRHEMDESLRPGFITPAIGDLDNDGIKEIVSAAGNRLYCFDATGEMKFEPIDFSANFYDDIREDRLSEANHIGPGALAPPVLYDLDNDSRMEIIMAGLDERVYAWHANGDPVEGWPVYLGTGTQGAKIIHSPCIADLDGDGMPEVIVSLNAVREPTDATPGGDSLLDGMEKGAFMDIPGQVIPPAMKFINSLIGKDCLVYAIHADGTMHDHHPDGENGRTLDTDAFVDGWPVTIKALLPDLLPFVGPSTKPAAADLDNDGKTEIIVSFTSASTSVINPTGKIIQKMDRGPMGSKAVGIRDRSLAVSMFGSIAIGDITGDHIPEIAQGGISLMGALNLVLSGQNLSYNHLMQVWDSKTGRFLDAYPRTMDDHMIYSEPAMADISGDGIPEVISGSGLNLVHAFGADGMDAPGFPKLSAGWIMTTPCAGDIDNDGKNEMAVVTREGWIFVWDTNGQPGSLSAWATFGHDNHTTSNTATDAIAPASIVDITGKPGGITFRAPGDDGFCGRAQSIRIYGLDEPIDVSNLDRATLIKEVEPLDCGQKMEVDLDPGYSYLAAIAVDEAGNRSQIPLVGDPGNTVSVEETTETSSPAVYDSGSDNGICFISCVQ